MVPCAKTGLCSTKKKPTRLIIQLQKASTQLRLKEIADFSLDSTHDSSGLMKIWVDSNLSQRLHVKEWVDSTWRKRYTILVESIENWLKCKKVVELGDGDKNIQAARTDRGKVCCAGKTVSVSLASTWLLWHLNIIIYMLTAQLQWKQRCVVMCKCVLTHLL